MPLNTRTTLSTSELRLIKWDLSTYLRLLSPTHSEAYVPWGEGWAYGGSFLYACIHVLLFPLPSSHSWMNIGQFTVIPAFWGMYLYTSPVHREEGIDGLALALQNDLRYPNLLWLMTEYDPVLSWVEAVPPEGGDHENMRNYCGSVYREIGSRVGLSFWETAHLPHGFCAGLILNLSSANYQLCDMSTPFRFLNLSFLFIIKINIETHPQFAMRIKDDNVCTALALAPDT